VAIIAVETNVPERIIRDWIEQLVSPNGHRVSLLRGFAQTAGLPNETISRLIDSYLLRAEEDRGIIRIELAHDRLIEPIQTDNARWREANTQSFQRAVVLWVSLNRPAWLLMRGDVLKDAKRWAASNESYLTSDERDYLEACRRVGHGSLGRLLRWRESRSGR
jgi:hypothetical protein